MKRFLIPVLALVLALSLTACALNEPKAPELTDNCFIVKVTFDTDVDVYSMLYARGNAEGGGFCYADNSKLNDVVYMTFNEDAWGDAPRMDGFVISLAPEIDGFTVEPVDITARYGNMYYVKVSGNAESGYTIVQTESGK